ncbi:hypothetical protein C2G38_2242491 [Gigaspora rosea]|uniref:Uncharacterized protein n=1 Tax=Gigaspora rosea TaxID=44941 RepID=A0A397VMJ5_9GLOM|nr:hypothetical protein C2G38_2242491 [Gigaspora rosea]
MSNYNNIFEKIYSSSDITQITNNITQLNLEDNNLQDLSFLNEIVKEMCNLYNEERLKGKNSDSVLKTLEQFLIKKKQNLSNIIDFCLNNQTSPTIQIILASCYRWMGVASGTFNVVYCYRLGIGVEKDERKAFIHYQNLQR